MGLSVQVEFLEGIKAIVDMDEIRFQGGRDGFHQVR